MGDRKLVRMTNQPSTTSPAAFVDADAMKAILARAARSYAQVLGGAGLVNAVMASSWAWAPRTAAIVLTVVGAIAVLAGALMWGRNNISTLRELTDVSRIFWAGTVLAWIVGAVVAIVTKNAVVWWVLAVLLVALGAYCWWAATRRADTIENRAKPAGAAH